MAANAPALARPRGNFFISGFLSPGVVKLSSCHIVTTPREVPCFHRGVHFVRVARHHSRGADVGGVTPQGGPRRPVCATSSISNHAPPLTGRGPTDRRSRRPS